MRPVVGVLTVILLAVFGSAAAAQPENEPGKLRVNNIDVTAAPAVSVTVTAPEELGTAALPPSAFVVREAGEPVAADVQRLPSDALDIVLVMDTSGSMEGAPMAAAQRSASEFIRQFPRGVRFSVVAFASRARVVTPFSRNIKTHLGAIQSLRASGETALYDGLATASAQFSGRNRRAVVLLSDGGDTVSRTTLGQARRQVTESGAAVYGIRYSTAETNSAALDGLAVRGRVIGAESAGALGRVYDTVASELVNQYRLTWETAGSGPTPAAITLTAGAVVATAKITLGLPGAPRPAKPVPQPVPEPATVPAPQPEEAAQPFLAARVAVLIGAVLFFIGTALLFLLIGTPRRRTVRIMGTPKPQGDTLHRSLAELAEHAVLAAERGLERRNLTARLNAALERAGINLRPAEFLVIVASAMLTAAAVGVATRSLLVGIAYALVVMFIARLYVTIRADRRSAKFADQLNDTLQLLAGSLRAGYGLLQAIDSVAQEAAEPTAHEFRRLVVESRLGRDLTTSLQAMSERIRNEDFDWVVQAILIHREVGGDLAEVLDTVAGTVRERNQIRRQIRALAAEGKLSGIILTVVPPAVGILISFINPGYLDPLFTTLPGLVMSFVGFVLMVIGGLWMRKTVRLVF